MRRRLAYLLSALLVLAFLAVLRPGRLLARLARADPVPVVLAVLSMVGALVCWSEGLRWLLTASGERVSPWRAFLAHTVGFFGKQLLPMGALGGPVVMTLAVERELSLGYDRTLALATAAEFSALVASVALGLGALVGMILLWPTAPTLRLLQLAVLAFAGTLLAAAVAFWYWRRQVRGVALLAAHLLRWPLGLLSDRLAASLAPERVTGSLGRYYRTLDGVAGDRRAVLVSGAYNLAGWLLAALPLYFAAGALDAPMPVALALFLVPASGLVTILPLPGGLGGVEFALTGAFAAAAGVDLPTAAAVVLLYRVPTYWFVLLIGGACSAYAATGLDDLAVE